MTRLLEGSVDAWYCPQEVVVLLQGQRDALERKLALFGGKYAEIAVPFYREVPCHPFRSILEYSQGTFP